MTAKGSQAITVPVKLSLTYRRSATPDSTEKLSSVLMAIDIENVRSNFPAQRKEASQHKICSLNANALVFPTNGDPCCAMSK